MKRIRELFKKGESGKIWLRTSVFVAVLAALTFGVMTLTRSDTSMAVAPAASPPGCTGNAPAGSIDFSPPGVHQNGDTISYFVSYSILPGSTNCDITGTNAFLIKPDGTSIQTLSNASISAGVVPETITCPGDAQCVAHPASDYEYTIEKADITGPALTCNSLTGELTYGPPPPNLVVARTIMNGTSQSDPVDQATLCPIKSTTVVHPDVKVEKTAKDDKVLAGEDAVYNITVTAIGDAPSTNVVLTDGGLDAGKVTVGGTDAALCDPITGGTLTCNFGTLDPAGVAGPVSASITLTHHTSPAQCPSISNTATVTADDEETLGNNSAGPVTIRVNCVTENPPIRKCVSDDLAFCIEFGNPHLANLWLCNTGAITCDNKAHGVEGVNFNLNLKGPVNGRDPKCYGFPNFQPIDTCPRQTIGAFEFEIRYDSKLVSVSVEPGSLWPRVTTPAGDVVLDPRVTCTTISTQNAIQFRCNVKGKTLVLNGPGTLAVVHVRPTADDYSLLIPSQLNGITTQLINQDCNLADLQGHPIKIAGQTQPGVGPAVCDDADVTIRYLEGDVHADCVIDVRDQQQIAFRWGSHLGQLLYSSLFDLEPSSPKLGDGDIDAKDLQMVFGRHDSTCKRPHPAQDPIDPKAKVEPPIV